MQKRAVRIMADLNPQDSCRDAFKNLGILTVVSIYITEVILLAIRQNCLRNRDIHERQTRHGNDFNLPAHRSALFAKKPTYAGARLYNMLPGELKNLGPQVLKRKMLK
uniref:Uncharacterized protein n=1 Tax=Homalodisca liturata TaxID=320908 RepID=A0A1B6J4Q9_9HEMI